MIKITLSPIRSDRPSPSLRAAGEVLFINGISFDFGPLPDGATLPASAIDSPWFAGPVERIDGDLHVTLLLLHGPNPSHAVAFPEPIIVTADGPVELPFDPPVNVASVKSELVALAEESLEPYKTRVADAAKELPDEH